MEVRAEPALSPLARDDAVGDAVKRDRADADAPAGSGTPSDRPSGGAQRATTRRVAAACVDDVCSP